MARDLRQPRRPVGGSLSALVSRASERIDRYHTPLGIAVLAVVAFLGYTAFKATTGPPFLPTYELTVKVPDDAPPLRKGQAVRVGGSLAGLIKSVTPDPANDRTLVKVNISKTNFRPLPVDTTAFVRVKSIVYVTYLQLTPGTSKEMLEDGDTLAAAAESGTDLLEVVELFDRQARENLSKTFVNVGFGVAGRGTELNGALRDLPATSRYLGDQLRAATKTPGALESVISGAAGTARGLRGRRPDDVAALIDSASATFGATARQRDALGRSIELLRPLEDEVLATAPTATPAFREIARASRSLSPAVRALNAQLPELAELTSLGTELREGFAALLGGGAGGAGGGGVGGSTGGGTGPAGIADQVLVAARPVVSGLFPIQTAVGPLNRDLDELVATITPYLPEITEAGKRLQSATSRRYQAGRAGAPALRLLPVLTPHPCLDPQPAPGQAQQNKATGGACR